MKAPHLHYSKTEEAIQMMRQVKNLFDPKGIMSTSHIPLIFLYRISDHETDPSACSCLADPYKYLPEEADPAQQKL